MIKVRFYNIQWDASKKSDLPESVTLEIDSNIDVEQDGAEVLTNKYGFLVNGFNFKIIKRF